MTTSASTLGIQLLTISNLQTQQTALQKLTEQLASGTQNDNLTDYDPTTAHQLLNLQNSITQRQSYITSMGNVSEVLSTYDLSFTDMESINSNALATVQQTQAYTPANQAQLQTEATDYLKQLSDDLNQSVSGSFIFSGARYTTQPVGDLSTLTAAPTTTTVSPPALANYDSQYTASAGSDANAYTSNTVTVDSNYNISYGVSSNDPSIQQLVNGLRYMQAASTATDQATYDSDVANAQSLLTSATTGIEALHAGVADNQNTITSETTVQNSNITALQNQIGTLSSVDTATIGTQMSLLETQLQASYSATASIDSLSLVKYL